MTEPGTALEFDTVLPATQAKVSWQRVCALLLTAIAILSSALHFWPLEDSRVWQMLSPPNVAVMLWTLMSVGFALLRPSRSPNTSTLPHVSVFAYVAINVLSIAFAPDLSRAANFTIKLTLMLLAGFTLFSSAMFSKAALRLVYGLVAAAVMISVSYCLASRFVLSSERCGFHNNAYKYGTYIGTLAPLCGAYFLTSSKSPKKLLGMVIVIAALISSGSLGATAAIVTGMMVLVVFSPSNSVRLCAIGCVLFGLSLVILLRSNPAVVFYRDDIKLADKDGVNLKQRYIEWQAEVNLLEERPITGTAAGCINEYRSKFYYRLPKLNTLAAFDQNGWLTTGAETGVLGLVCFCWIVMYYGGLAFSQMTAAWHNQSVVVGRFAGANFAGLVSACTVNLFSSIHYNGILIVFVLVLALICRTNRLFGEHQNASL